MSGYVLSEDAVIYYNAGSYETPDWTELDIVKDVSLNLETGEVDVTTRASGGWTESVAGSLSASCEFEVLWDPTDAAFSVLRQAFFNKTSVEILVLDGAHDATDGNSQGLRAECMVSNFSRSETLGEALTASVTLNPVRNSNSHPTWYTQS